MTNHRTVELTGRQLMSVNPVLVPFSLPHPFYTPLKQCASEGQSSCSVSKVRGDTFLVHPEMLLYSQPPAGGSRSPA